MARRFHPREGGLQVGVPLDGIVHQRCQLRIAKGANPIRNNWAAPMRTCPRPGELLADRFGRDLGAKWWDWQGATGEQEAPTEADKRASHHAHRLMQFGHEPVQLRRDANEDFADDVQEFYMVGVDSAAAARARREEKAPILFGQKQPDRDALFRRR